MDFATYLDTVRARFTTHSSHVVGRYNTEVFYEEFFKAEWFFTKLKVFSAIAHAPTADAALMADYCESCVQHAKNTKPGLPVGFQNGLVCFNVLVVDSTEPSGVQFARTRPRKLFSIFDMPVLYDLSTGTAHYYSGPIVWGKLYEKFIKDYAAQHFGALRGE